MRPNAVIKASVKPSAKNACVSSPVVFASGRTASVGISFVRGQLPLHAVECAGDGDDQQRRDGSCPRADTRRYAVC